MFLRNFDFFIVNISDNFLVKFSLFFLASGVEVGSSFAVIALSTSILIFAELGADVPPPFILRFLRTSTATDLLLP